MLWCDFCVFSISVTSLTLSPRSMWFINIWIFSFCNFFCSVVKGEVAIPIVLSVVVFAYATSYSSEISYRTRNRVSIILKCLICKIFGEVCYEYVMNIKYAFSRENHKDYVNVTVCLSLDFSVFIWRMGHD